MRFNGTETIWGGYRWDKATEQRLKNEKCLEGYGFYAVEHDANNNAFAWSSNHESAVLINGNKLNGAKSMVIPYYTCVNEELVTVIMNGETMLKDMPLSSNGEIEISLEGNVDYSAGNQLVFQCSKLVSPKKLGINDDQRELGIAIMIDNIRPL